MLFNRACKICYRRWVPIRIRGHGSSPAATMMEQRVGGKEGRREGGKEGRREGGTEERSEGEVSLLKSATQRNLLYNGTGSS
jgi:hypothetical protein